MLTSRLVCRSETGAVLHGWEESVPEDVVPGYFGSALEAQEVQGFHNVYFRGVSAHPDRSPAQQVGWAAE